MGKHSILLCILQLLLVVQISRAANYRVCASDKSVSECQAIERGDSAVSCTPVVDSAECLIKMEDNKADFAVFTAEEVLLAASKNVDFEVVASVKVEEKRYDQYAYQAVALVKSSHTGGLQGLKGGKLCHPGYDKTKEQLWSEKVLKYFEKIVGVSKSCNTSVKNPAEGDVADLSSFFSEACRPGPWVADPAEDKRLKEKFPTLCTLCTSNNSPDCDGYRYFEPRNPSVNSHLSAIECMVTGRGSVAYVAYHHILEYFKNDTAMSGYRLLCEDGTLATLGNKNASCAWISQHWGALVARKDKSSELLKDLKQWMGNGRDKDSKTWVTSLDAILFKDQTDVLVYPSDPISLKDYVIQGRPSAPSETCYKPLKWCTISDLENRKCEWIKVSASSLGLQPNIECVQARSHIECLSRIKDSTADFVSVDSNLGFLARKHYNLTAAMYHETSRKMASKVFAFIKSSSANSIQRFENLKDKTACFPEYGGIAWVAFLRTAHERRIISNKECDYAYQIVNFFKASCAPGADDEAHFPSKAVDSNKLCEACKGTNGVNEMGIEPYLPKTCLADPSNMYYGNKGALRCLKKEDSHVAFIEGQNLESHANNLSYNPQEFRALCRNNSLASNNGFNVDDDCALSVTIDSEVIVRRGFEYKLNLQLLLLELDNSFGYNTGNSKLVNLKVFSEFDGVKDLLFKDSTTGLVNEKSENTLVKNYIELFKHTEMCTGGAKKTTISLSLILIIAVVAMFK